MDLLDVLVDGPVYVIKDAMQCCGPHGGMTYPSAGEASLKHAVHHSDIQTLRHSDVQTADQQTYNGAAMLQY